MQTIRIEGFPECLGMDQGSVLELFATGFVPRTNLCFQVPLEAGCVSRVWLLTFFIVVGFPFLQLLFPGLAGVRLQCLYSLVRVKPVLVISIPFALRPAAASPVSPE